MAQQFNEGGYYKNDECPTYGQLQLRCALQQRLLASLQAPRQVYIVVEIPTKAGAERADNVQKLPETVTVEYAAREEVQGMREKVDALETKLREMNLKQEEHKPAQEARADPVLTDVKGANETVNREVLRYFSEDGVQ